MPVPLPIFEDSPPVRVGTLRVGTRCRFGVFRMILGRSPFSAWPSALMGQQVMVVGPEWRVDPGRDVLGQHPTRAGRPASSSPSGRQRRSQTWREEGGSGSPSGTTESRARKGPETIKREKDPPAPPDKRNLKSTRREGAGPVSVSSSVVARRLEMVGRRLIDVARLARNSLVTTSIWQRVAPTPLRRLGISSTAPVGPRLHHARTGWGDSSLQDREHQHGPGPQVTVENSASSLQIATSAFPSLWNLCWQKRSLKSFDR